MKFVNINAYQVGLVFRNETYLKALPEGIHFVGPFQTVKVYDITKPFAVPCSLDILLTDKVLADLLEVIDVKDQEIVLQYENDVFKTVLKPGRHAFWKSMVNYRYVRADLSKVEITEAIDLTSLTSKEVLAYMRSYTVESYEKGLLFVNGKYQKVLEAGTYYWWRNNLSVHISKVDTRQLQLEIAGQEILTKDKATLRINFYVQYKVTDIMKALLENKDIDKQLYILMQLGLREYIGTLTLDELLEKKEGISKFILDAIAENAGQLGVTLVNCGIRDVILPGDMKEIMNRVLIAEKTAQANIIMRREETASMRSLLNTAKLMEENEMLFRLKEMEYVEKIADKINTISISGGGQVLDQLKQIFGTAK
ncbi:slipin family protein [Runella zeae]|uniref:slipin family protein n=1 Tax=Runella zeae TaxID=94255 RepID=UPI00041066B1|nr:slipin family protein [Runella zeae]